MHWPQPTAGRHLRHPKRSPDNSGIERTLSQLLLFCNRALLLIGIGFLGDTARPQDGGVATARRNGTHGIATAQWRAPHGTGTGRGATGRLHAREAQESRFFLRLKDAVAERAMRGSGTNRGNQKHTRPLARCNQRPPRRGWPMTAATGCRLVIQQGPVTLAMRTSVVDSAFLAAFRDVVRATVSGERAFLPVRYRFRASATTSR